MDMRMGSGSRKRSRKSKDIDHKLFQGEIMNLLYAILQKKDFAELLKSLSDVYTAVDINQVVRFDKKTVQEGDVQQDRIVLAPIIPNEPMLLKVASESSGKIKVDMKTQSIHFLDCEIQESLSSDNMDIQAQKMKEVILDIE